MYGSLGPLVPTYTKCFVQDAQDALLLVQAVVDNRLSPVERRPQDQERSELIKSGNIFIFDEKRGHIQRWTDGISWSPSRILGEFLIYRERKQGQRNSQNSTAFNKKPIGSNSDTKPGVNGSSINKKSIPSRHRVSNSGDRFDMMMSAMESPHYVKYQGSTEMPHGYASQQLSANSNRNQTSEYNLYGSLTSNEQYKENGLIKKTISVPYKSSSYRLISYYFPEDVEAQRLSIPSEDPKFADITIQPELAETKNVKLSITINPQDIGLGTPYPQGIPAFNGRAEPYGQYRLRSSMGASMYPAPLVRATNMYGSMMPYRRSDGTLNNVMPYANGQQRNSPDSSDSYSYSPVDPSISRGIGQTSENYMDLEVYPQHVTNGSMSNQAHYESPYVASYQNRSHSQPSISLAISNNSKMQHAPENLFAARQNSQQRQSGHWGSIDIPSTAGHYSMDERELITDSPPIVRAIPGTIMSANSHQFEDIPAKSGEAKASGGYPKSDETNSANFQDANDNINNTLFTEMSPSQDDEPLRDSVGQSGGGLSASIIAQDSDGYEPMYGSGSPSSDSHLNDSEVMPKEFGHGNILNHYSHNEYSDSGETQLPTASQRLYLSATTAPYDIHSI